MASHATNILDRISNTNRLGYESMAKDVRMRDWIELSGTTNRSDGPNCPETIHVAEDIFVVRGAGAFKTATQDFIVDQNGCLAAHSFAFDHDLEMATVKLKVFGLKVYCLTHPESV